MLANGVKWQDVSNSFRKCSVTLPEPIKLSSVKSQKSQFNKKITFWRKSHLEHHFITIMMNIWHILKTQGSRSFTTELSKNIVWLYRSIYLQYYLVPAILNMSHSVETNSYVLISSEIKYYGLLTQIVNQSSILC